MRRTTLHIIILLLFTLPSIAQTNIEKIETLLTEEKVKDAEKLLDQTILLDSTNAKLYFYKALILQNRLSIDLPIEEKSLLLSQINQNLKLSLINDHNHSLSKLQKEELLTLKQQYLYVGMALFNEKEYDKALDFFEENLKISALPLVQELDTMVWLNAAIAAEKCKQLNKAEFYYSNIILYSTNAWQSYISLANIYKLQSKDEEFFNTLKEASLKYPKKELYFNDEIISFYLEKGNYELGLKYIDQSLKTDSLNDKLQYLKGSILQELNKNNQALVSYKKALTIKPENTDAAFNIAAIYYNQSITIYKKGKLKRKEKKQVEETVNKALKYLLIVHESEPTDINVLKMIHSCYTILKKKNEQKIYEAKINSIKK